MEFKIPSLPWLGTVSFRLDTILVCLTLMIGGAISTKMITNRLNENALIAKENANQTREVLVEILQRMNDNQHLFDQMKEVQVKQRELEIKAADIMERLAMKAK